MYSGRVDLRRLLPIAAIALLGSSCASLIDATVSDNSELASILEADQKDRQSDIAQIDWAKVGPRDAERRAKVKKLLDSGQVRTGPDFTRASLVFQHGDGSDDILMAHILAVTALGKGDHDARRMSAITLDRYLNRIGQAQVFGTQFNTSNLKDPTQWTMDPYRSDFISDALRAHNCVEPLAEQQKILKDMREGRDLQEPKDKTCDMPIPPAAGQ